MRLYAVTTNPGKFAGIRRQRERRRHPGPRTTKPCLPLEPVEDAETFIGNAEIKAIAYPLCLAVA